MHEQFVEPKDADIIIPEGANTVAVTLLEEKIAAETGTVPEWGRGQTGRLRRFEPPRRILTRTA